jgi:hypothetical protein
MIGSFRQIAQSTVQRSHIPGLHHRAFYLNRALHPSLSSAKDQSSMISIMVHAYLTDHHQQLQHPPTFKVFFIYISTVK